MLKGLPATIEMGGGWRYCKVLSIGHTKVTCLGACEEKKLGSYKVHLGSGQEGSQDCNCILDTNVILGKNFNFSVP